jgi:hypothetical protein
MAIWIFRCYDPSTPSRGGFHEWYDVLPPAIAAEVDQALNVLSREKKWGLPEYKDLDGKCSGLGEIRIDIAQASDDPEKELPPLCFRILGFEGPEKRQFTLLVGFQKITGSEYSVECPKALQRKKGVLKDGSRAPQCYFP